MLTRRLLLGSSLLLGVGCIAPTTSAQQQPASPQRPATINSMLTGDISPVHDPCIIRQGDTYYVFCTTGEGHPGQGYVAIRTSTDLIHWRLSGYVFTEIPQWARSAVPGTRGIWAPDISFYNNRYHLYYAVSTFGSNHSVIGLATNATLDPTSPDYAWRDDGLVLQSQQFDRFNAIDPNLVADKDGKYWLSWGSFWSGIKMASIDPATGKLNAQDRTIHAIAARPDPVDAIEAPFIITHGEYYYLFCSYDFCCRGVNSTYFVACGRSRSIIGPYEGVDGPMTRGGASVVIQADEHFKGPGHNGVLRDGDRDFLVYHAYDVQNNGVPTLRISPIYWTPDGWPRAML